jgi:cytochrome P450
MKDAAHELLIYAWSHPIALLFAEASARLGDIADVPFVGRVVNQPDLARAILSDDDNFSKTGPGSFGVLITQVMGKKALLNMDGEEHMALRSKLTELFSPAYLEIVEREVLSPPIEELRCRLARGERVDIVRFAQLLTGRTTWHMLGFAQPDHDGESDYLQVFGLTRQLTSSIRLSTRKLSPSQVVAKRGAFEQMTAPVATAYAGDGLPERSVIARLQQLGVTADEARGVVASILIAGTETVTTAVPRAIALLIDSGQQSVLRAEPKLLQGAVDEALRVTVPTPVNVRSVAHDCEVHGVRFRAGERVMLLTYNIVKHGASYPHPRRFDIRRQHPPSARNLWFGAGHHFCLGFALAQREMKMVLSAIASLPGELQVRRRAYARGSLLPGYSRLEVQMR